MGSSDDPSRGQVILIGAISLAVIILTIVVVFNGVLYTETISAGDTTQSAATAEKVGLEVEQAVACDYPVDGFEEQYQNLTSASSSAVVDIDNSGEEEVTITYDSADLSYEQTRNVTADCPHEESE